MLPKDIAGIFSRLFISGFFVPSSRASSSCGSRCRISFSLRRFDQSVRRLSSSYSAGSPSCWVCSFKAFGFP
jgi:hypothetical protein